MADQYSSGVLYNRNTGEASPSHYGYGLDQTPTSGRVRDGLGYGGYAATVDVGPDGKVTTEPGHSGLADAVNRYQGMGAAAAGRGAYRANYWTADQDAAAGQTMRGDEQEALHGLRNSAAGVGPTATTGLGRAAADQSMQGALAASAGGRGGLAQAALAHQAYGQQVGQGVHNAAALAGMRAGEMGAARGAYGAGAATMRGQDLGYQGMLQRRATTQADSEIQQRQLNQQQQMGYEGLGFAARQAQIGAQQRQDETDAGIYGNSLSIGNQEKNRALAYLGAGYSTAGSGLAAFSTYGRGGGGGGGVPLGGGGGGDYQGAPIQRGDPYGDEQQPAEDDGSDPYGGIGR